MIRRRVGTGAVFLAALAAAGAAEPLRSTWVWRPAAGVEWVDIAGRPGQEIVLFATRRGELRLVDPRDGRPLSTPIEARPGVRRALPATPDLLYAYDRASAYAIALEPLIMLRWQVGTWRGGLGEGPTTTSSPAQMFQGDPEELRRIVGAQPTGRGLLVARDDGRVALLDAGDGHLAWQTCLPRLANARLHARADAAALLWQEGPHPHATFLSTTSGDRQDLGTLQATGWPTQSALAEAGLLLAFPDQLVLCTPAGARLLFHSPSDDSILSATLTLWAGPAATQAAARREGVVFGATDGRLRALRLVDGNVLWSVRDQPEHKPAWKAIRVDEDLLIVMTDTSVRIRDVTNGGLLAEVTAPPGHKYLDVGLIGTTVWLLSRCTSGNAAMAYLFACPRPCPGSASPGGDIAQPPTQLQDAGAIDTLLRSAWTSRSLVIATPTELRAYNLP